MATGARVVAVQARDGVEPEQPADVCELRIERTPEPLRQRLPDPTSEALLLEVRVEAVCQTVAPAEERGRPEHEQPDPRRRADSREPGGDTQQSLHAPPDRYAACVRSDRSRTGHPGGAGARTTSHPRRCCR